MALEKGLMTSETIGLLVTRRLCGAFILANFEAGRSITKIRFYKISTFLPGYLTVTTFRFCSSLYRKVSLKNSENIFELHTLY